MNQISKLSIAVSAALAAYSVPSFAQETLERVQVTGSNIKRLEGETASPVQVLSRQDLERTGKATVQEILQTLSADSNGSLRSGLSGGFASGGGGMSLRGLGSTATLVLINGRRVAPFGLADDGQRTFTDLSIIPFEAVERIEILKDGASAIYGSDAIAGVVNVILRKEYAGTSASVNFGQSRYGDGTERKVTLTHGFGNLTQDGYNGLINIELGKTGAIDNRDRASRGWIGAGDTRQYGYASGFAIGASEYGPYFAPSSPVGNVRNPNTFLYYSRDSQDPAAGFTRTFAANSCAKFSSVAQGDPAGWCLYDVTREKGQIQPDVTTANIYGHVTRRLTDGIDLYADLNWYRGTVDNKFGGRGVNNNSNYPGGLVRNSGISLGADHPDNPYFGAAAVLRYLPNDLNYENDMTSTFGRAMVGIKGTMGGWDFDTALLSSFDRANTVAKGFLNRNTTFALLNPQGNDLSALQTNAQVAAQRSAAYAALPPGTFWRIGENAGLNSQAMYAALAPDITALGKSKITQVDFKASRELMELDGGPLGLAVGVELRRESMNLTPFTGTDKGEIIGRGYAAYDGSRTQGAVYAELVAPVLKTLELSGAARADHYSDAGNSVTPKIGVKWTPVRSFAMRATYAEGFRAPAATENGSGLSAGFTFTGDPVRCAVVPAACGATFYPEQKAPSADLKPEKSKSMTLGFLIEPTSGTSLLIDAWQIKRNNEINKGLPAIVISSGSVLRDPVGPGSPPGDPGALASILNRYQNSRSTTVNGVDLDFKQRFQLGDTKLLLNAVWTHMFKWERIDQDGTRYDFAGTHGDIDLSYGLGTPKDRINFSAGFSSGALSYGLTVNYRGSISNKYFRNDPAGCASTLADYTTPAPNPQCTVPSFTTLDLSASYAFSPKFQISASIQNLFDHVAPLDPLSYIGNYSSYDIFGAVGRYLRVGARYTF